MLNLNSNIEDYITCNYVQNSNNSNNNNDINNIVIIIIIIIMIYKRTKI